MRNKSLSVIWKWMRRKESGQLVFRIEPKVLGLGPKKIEVSEVQNSRNKNSKNCTPKLERPKFLRHLSEYRSKIVVPVESFKSLTRIWVFGAFGFREHWWRHCNIPFFFFDCNIHLKRFELMLKMHSKKKNNNKMKQWSD